MTADPRALAGVAWLEAHGAAEIEHPGGTLLAHLERTSARLARWGASADVQLAGLAHATYGTAGFGVALLDLSRRPELAGVIGAPAEALVYLYCSCDRTTTYAQLGSDDVEVGDRFTGVPVRPDPDAARAFVEITAANELDLLEVNPEFAARHGAALLRLMQRGRRYLSSAALDDWHAPVG